MPLTYTPRKFISHPYGTVFYMIETDHRVLGPKAIERIASEKVGLYPRYLGRTDVFVGGEWKSSG
jgi:hypothetical protein